MSLKMSQPKSSLVFWRLFNTRGVSLQRYLEEKETLVGLRFAFARFSWKNSRQTLSSL